MNISVSCTTARVDEVDELSEQQRRHRDACREDAVERAALGLLDEGAARAGGREEQEHDAEAGGVEGDGRVLLLFADEVARLDLDQSARARRRPGAPGSGSPFSRCPSISSIFAFCSGVSPPLQRSTSSMPLRAIEAGIAVIATFWARPAEDLRARRGRRCPRGSRCAAARPTDRTRSGSRRSPSG